MVAPNSPMALAKHRIMPAMMPGTISGSVTVRKTQARLAPSVPAASSSRASTASIDRRMARTSSGKPMTPQASAAPVQRNEKTMPKWSARKAADRPAPAEQDQQDVAGDDRRQDQRQEHEAVEQGVAPEATARQQPWRRRCRTAGSTSVATRATLRLSRTAVHSSGLRVIQSIVGSPQRSPCSAARVVRIARAQHREALRLEQRLGLVRSEVGEECRGVGIAWRWPSGRWDR